MQEQAPQHTGPELLAAMMETRAQERAPPEKACWNIFNTLANGAPLLAGGGGCSVDMPPTKRAKADAGAGISTPRSDIYILLRSP
jgi:hypothetical protein